MASGAAGAPGQAAPSPAAEAVAIETARAPSPRLRMVANRAQVQQGNQQPATNRNAPVRIHIC